MTVRAKFRCHFIQESSDGASRTVNLSAVTSGSTENESWSKCTPGGQLSMHISNPDAFSQFEQGNEYFIEVNPAVSEINSGNNSLNNKVDHIYFDAGR